MGEKKAKAFRVLLMAVVIAFAVSCGGAHEDEDVNCGNGSCDKGEDVILLTDPIQFKCNQDCAGICGDGVCNACYENHDSCPQDCAD